jgi:uncharacterized glyoxalase superfamily protein PhnB
MHPLPIEWPQLSSAIFYDDANAAIDWLCKAFGFELRIKVADKKGGVMHSELVYGHALVMVSSSDRAGAASPRGVGGKNTQRLFLYVEDADRHCARAREAGAVIVTEPHDSDYGPDHWADRGYECTDPEGHGWWFAHRVRNLSPKIV